MGGGKDDIPWRELKVKELGRLSPGSDPGESTVLWAQAPSGPTGRGQMQVAEKRQINRILVTRGGI